VYYPFTTISLAPIAVPAITDGSSALVSNDQSVCTKYCCPIVRSSGDPAVAIATAVP